MMSCRCKVDNQHVFQELIQQKFCLGLKLLVLRNFKQSQKQPCIWSSPKNEGIAFVWLIGEACCVAQIQNCHVRIEPSIMCEIKFFSNPKVKSPGRTSTSWIAIYPASNHLPAIQPSFTFHTSTSSAYERNNWHHPRFWYFNINPTCFKWISNFHVSQWLNHVIKMHLFLGK